MNRIAQLARRGVRTYANALTFERALPSQITLSTSTKPLITSIPVRAFSSDKSSGFWDNIINGNKEQQPNGSQAGTKAETTPEQQQSQQSQQSQQPQEQTQQQQQQQPTAEVKAEPAPQGPDYKKQVADLKAEIQRLTTAVTQKDALLKEREDKMKELHNRVLQELAEQENVRMRAAKDVANAKQFGISKFAKGLLEILDTLDMAVQASERALSQRPNDDLKALLDGVQMTRTLFFKTMADSDIRKYESMGEKADPNLHFVAAQVPDETKPPGTIIAVVKEGYKIGDRVLRPAQVAVVAPR